MTKKRVLFCIDSNAYLRHIAPIIFRFADSNNYDVEVFFLGVKDNLRENTLELLAQKVFNIKAFYGRHRKLNIFFQNILALLLFLNPYHSSPLLLDRTSAPRIVKVAIRRLTYFPQLSNIIGNLLLFLFRNIYKFSLLFDPQFYFFRSYLKRRQFTFVFSAPYIFPHTRSVPLQFACRLTKTPLVGQIASWDNLTTKGTWVIKPDQFFVWNKAMKHQLAAIHPGIEQITDYHGSPTFESTKGYQSPFSRDTFLESLSLNKDDVYILYMCSSPSIGGYNEDRVIAELISTLARADILTGNVHLVIRTHPLLNLKNSSIFNNPPSNVIFYPKDSTSPNLSSNANDIYLSTILYSDLVIGQNTSAFLDVCLLDRPCITLPEYPGLYNPSKFGHIELLLDGGFIHQPSSSEQLAYLVSDILSSGGDLLRNNRSKFISSFLYPDQSLPSLSIFNKLCKLY